MEPYALLLGQVDVPSWWSLVLWLCYRLLQLYLSHLVLVCSPSVTDRHFKAEVSQQMWLLWGDI